MHRSYADQDLWNKDSFLCLIDTQDKTFNWQSCKVKHELADLFLSFFFKKKIQFLKVLISMSLTIGSTLIFYRVFWCCMLIFYRVFTTVAVRPKFYAEYSPDQ